MTKYRINRIDRIITGAYAGPLAKRHCAALRHALTLMWTVMTLPNAPDAFRPNHFVLLVDRWAHVEMMPGFHPHVTYVTYVTSVLPQQFYVVT